MSLKKKKMTGFNYSKSHTQKDRFRLVETAAASTNLKVTLRIPEKDRKLFFLLFDILLRESEKQIHYRRCDANHSRIDYVL